jgi:DNA-binding transcriptional LysR family regulator
MKIPHITLAQLRVFVALAENGSFTAAGTCLSMTQSAVSHALASLEAELEMLLIDRSRPGISVTAFGERILVYAREMLRYEEAIRQEAAAAKGLAIGRLRIGSISSVATRWLPGLLAAFQRRYPGIDTVVFEGTDQEVQQWLTSRTVDVGLLALPVVGVAFSVIGEDELCAVLPADHALTQQVAVRVEQLAQEPFIMPQGGCEPLIRHVFGVGGTAPNVQYNVREMSTTIAMVQEALGVTLVPTLALPQHLTNVQVLPLDPSIRRQLALAVLTFEQMSPALIAFVQHATAWAVEEAKVSMSIT